MPDNINPLVGKQPGEGAAAAHNAEVAAKLADQDTSNRPSSPEDISNTSAALDALAAKVVPKPDPEPKPDAARVEPKPDAARTEPKPDSTPVKVEPKPDANTPDPAQKRAEEIFKDTPGLPPGASPKSSEAFATVKIKAAQEITARDQEIEKLKAQVGELEKTKGKPTPEQQQAEKELAELREWRAKLDVDYDPKFKEHDKGITAARDFVYAQLQKHPGIVTPEVIAEIKKFGGPDKTILTKLFEAINDPVTQRLVESKLADIEMMKYQKDQAIAQAKTNIGEWTKSRQEEWQKAATEHTRTTQSSLDPMLGALEWFKDKTPAADADEAAKKNVEEHNKFVGELRGQIGDVIKDDSPQMRAILIAGMAQLFNLQRVHASTKAEAETLKKDLTAVTEKYDRLKGASVSRLRESGAPASGSTPAAKPTTLNTNTGDALDSIARQVMEQRAAAGKA
jgi:hypothetical protein